MASIGQLAVAVVMAFDSEVDTTNASICEQKSLDNSPQWCIIGFTAVLEFDSGIEHAADAQGYGQAKDVTASGHTQSSPPGCATSSVPRQRILRPGRHDSGQVRDASTGPCRHFVHFPGSPRVWAFPAVVLPGQLRLRAGWPVGAGAAETRPQKRSQTHAGSDGIRSGKANIGSVAQFSSTGGSREDGFQRSGSPAQHRASVSAGKKTSLKSSLAPLAAPKEEALIAGYEELRRQALIGHAGADCRIACRLCETRGSFRKR